MTTRIANDLGTQAPLRLVVAGSGEGSNFQALMDRIRSGHVHARVVQVVSDREDAGILPRAQREGVTTTVLPPRVGEQRDAYDARVLGQLAPCDLVVLAGFMRIVGPRWMQATKGQIVNVHPSLLPEHKGLQAVRQAHARGDPVVGCSTHLVTPSLDSGPIILQAALRARPQEEVAALQRRVLALEHLILPRTVQLFAEGRLRPAQPGPPPGRPASDPLQQAVGSHDRNVWPFPVVAEGSCTHLVVAGGPSWLGRADLPLVSGAWYSEGF